MDLPELTELDVATLGPCRFDSPLGRSPFVDDDARVLLTARTNRLRGFLRAAGPLPSFELAGPRRRIFFEPARLRCGIVTCGGLCPGLNNVIRSIVLTLHHHYGVRRILGFRYGYAGLARPSDLLPVELTPAFVERIHETGGTVLGSSRGPQDLGVMADTLAANEIGILFAIGGDGTLRGASALNQELRRRNQETAVIGVPKTIDNDIEWVQRSFGFTTAVETARESIRAAHVEAVGSLNGVGLVKLMGRHSGFIAAEATLASSDVNFCLVPELPVQLGGERGFLVALEERLRARRHAVVVVAEGAGQDLFAAEEQQLDASGNVKLFDIGVRLRDEIRRHLSARGLDHTLKYIDPSYIVRSLPANSMDSTLCLLLGQQAVHAGMAGRTDMLVSYWSREFTHVPIAVAVARRKQIRPDGSIWQRVLESTGQGPMAG